jgi:APA family basic amino acid/polyamine antiporter
MPKAGGEYVYAKRTFGKTIGMLLGLIISVNGIISGATVSLGFAGYFFKLFEASELLISLGIIGLIFLINVSGIRQSSVINIVFTLIEAAGLLLVIYVAFPFIGSVNYLELPEKGWNRLLTASALGFFAYIGFEEIVKLAEETKNPEKTIPRALFIANGIVAILYMLVAVCAVSAISAQQLGESQSPLADVVGSRLGKSAVTAITIIALFSTANTILSNMLGSSRVLLDMSRHIKWMKAISYVSPKRQTPFFALVLILIIMCLFALIGKIETIARIANLFIFTTFIVINLCVIVLRVKEKEMRRPYRIPLNIGNIPVLSVAAMLLTLLLLIYNVIALSNL